MASNQTDSGVSTGYLPVPAPEDHDITVTVAGKTRTFAGLEAVEWAFLGISFVNVLTCIGFTLAVVIKEDSSEPGFTFALLILINTGFCLLYVIHGILREKEFEIYAYMAASVCVVIYCILGYSLYKDQHNIKLARMILGCCLVPINTVLGVIVARRFGWLEFKIVGASEVMQYMYREASRFSSLLKFDLQSVLTFIILVLRQATSEWKLEVLIVSVGTIFSVLWCLFGWVSMRKELRVGAWIFGLLGIVAPALAIGIIIRIYGRIWRYSEQEESMIDYTALGAGAVFLTVRAILFFELYRVSRNFNQGLKERAFDVDERTSLLSVASKR